MNSLYCEVIISIQDVDIDVQFTGVKLMIQEM